MTPSHDIELISLSRSGRRIYLKVRGDFQRLVTAVKWTYVREGVVDADYDVYIPDSTDVSIMWEYTKLFIWVRQRFPAITPIEIIERCDMTDEYTRLCQKFPVEALQMLSDADAALTT